MENDRRQYFRATCDVLLELKIVENPADFSIVMDEDPILKLHHEFSQLDSECQDLTRQLKLQDKNLDEYLTLTQAKLKKLEQMILAQHPALNKLERQTVQFNEQGMDCYCRQPLVPKTRVGVHLVFLPHYQSMIGLGEVLRSEPASDNPSSNNPSSNNGGFRIALDFALLPDSERKILAQEVMIAQRRAQQSRKA